MDEIHGAAFAPTSSLNIVACNKNSCKINDRYFYENIEKIGGGAQSDWARFSPLINNIIKISKGLILIIIITFATMDIYGTLSCKEQYIRLRSKFASQYIIFLVIFLLVFILSAETINPMMARSVSIGRTLVGAVIVWILFNIISQAGDVWFSFSSPFWPGPLTFWIPILLLMCGLYIMDLMKQYWVSRQQKVVVQGDTIHSYIVRLEKAEKLTTAAIIGLITYGYYTAISGEKQRLKSKFSLYNFIFDRFITRGGKDRWKGLKHKCSPQRLSSIQREINAGIKNSWWRNIWT